MKTERGVKNYVLSYDVGMKSYKEEWTSFSPVSFPLYAYTRNSSEEGTCPPHWHEQIEIVMIMHGTICHKINRNAFIAGPDDIIIVHQGRTHSWEIVSDPPIEMLVVQFLPSLITPSTWRSIESEYILSFLNSVPSQLEHLSNARVCYPELHGMVNNIYREYVTSEPGREIYITGYIFQFIASLVRSGLIGEKDPVSKQDLEKIAPLLRYIEKNYQSRIRLEEAAKMLNYDYYYMSRIFKRLTQKTFTQYLDSVRVYEAEKLMMRQKMTVCDVAFQVGFENVASFNRAYKRIRNCPPGAFKQWMINKDDKIQTEETQISI